MRNLKRQLPEGVADVPPAACRRKRALENGLLDLFSRWGYDEVQAPTLEYLDTFLRAGEQNPERLYKLTDASGSLLALRPDLTTSIARIAATRLRQEPLPLRLCYVQEAFSYQLRYGRTQYAQAGVELIGDDRACADAEVIALAIRGLQAMGLEDFQMDIGQVEFFLGLVEEAGFSEEFAESLRELVEEKNMLGVELLLGDVGMASEAIGEELRRRLTLLPMLYGGREVLDEAEKLSQHPACLRGLANIRKVLDILEDYGLSEYVSVDLGMVHALHYYTGIIFRGITKHLGHPLLSGGRYDKLMGDFERPLPATGFAMEVDRVLELLERQESAAAAGVDLLIVYAPELRRQALGRIEALRAQAFRVATLEGATDAEAVAQARAQHARGAQRFDGAGNPVIYAGEDEGGEAI